MKHIPATVQTDLPATLADVLGGYRTERGFDAAYHLDAKVNLINAYAAEYDLTHAVLGISGGLDSSVAAAILARTTLRPTLVFMPSSDTSGQAEAHARAAEVAAGLGLPLHTVSMDLLVEATHSTVGYITADNKVSTSEKGGWARGQLAANTRALCLYHLCTVLNDVDDNRAVVAGTTNLDEGGWLGYVGKTSDGLVDIQLISDLHKSEVYALAAHLGLPAAIQDAVPTGDMFDSRTDLDVMGATYDYVELLRPYLTNPAAFTAALDTEGAQAWALGFGNLSTLHAYNAHKYNAASPAVHLDVLPSNIPGGWRTNPWVPQPSTERPVIHEMGAR